MTGKRKKKIRDVMTRLSSFAVIGVLAMAGVASAQTSDSGVSPILDSTSQLSCSTLNADDTNYPGITSDYGFKIDANPHGGTYYLVGGTQNGDGTTMTGGAADDSTNSVHITNTAYEDGTDQSTEFDWTSTLGMDAVIVKAQDSNVYVYTPEAFADGGLQAPGLKAISHIEFCYDYELTVSKTAETSFTRTYDWTITKDYDGTYDKFIGDGATSHGYTVSVDQTVTDSNWAVAGSIVIVNNTPFDADVTGVTDVVSVGIAATVDCGVTIPSVILAGDTLTCTYSAALPDAVDRTNTATVTTTGSVGGGEALADVTFAAATITTSGFPTINVTDTNGESWMASGDASWTYSRDFVCSTNSADYTNGFYTFTHPNTATITETVQSDNATVTVNCYAPVSSKDANTSYTRTYTWDITKGDNATYNWFIGDPGTAHGYTVSVDQIINESNFAVAGTITVTNPHPSSAMIVTLTDSVGGTAATLACSGTLTVPANSSATCGYSADLASKTDGTNTATATLNDIDFSATADYAFGDPTTVVGSSDINVTDTNGESWEASGDASWTYNKDFVCSTNPAAYTNGSYSFTHSNTATITETGQFDDATVTVNCYAPVSSKDANALYTRQFDWTITKDYDGTYTGIIGQSWSHGYEVSVDQTVSEYGFAVAGTITVVNPNPAAAMTVTLTDSVGGTAATLACSGTLTVPAGSSATCGYSADLASKTDGTNTATATLNGIDFTATADYAFGDPTTVVGSSDINVTDTNDESWEASGDDLWPYSRDFSCPTDPSVYTNGFHTFTHVNTATITETGQSDIATVIVNCTLPPLGGGQDIQKTAAGSYDRTVTWTLEKTVAPASHSGYPGDTFDSTWTVVATKDEVSDSYQVTGSITIVNSGPIPQTFTISDVLDDSTTASVACPTYTVPARADGTDGEVICSYEAFPADDSATLNTVTVTAPGNLPLTGTAAVSFTETLFGYDEGTLGDERFDFSLPISVTTTMTVDETFDCSTVRADYGETGSYSYTETNIATLNDNINLSDDAQVDVTCDTSFVDIYKTTNGQPADPTKDIVFTLYDDGGSLLETKSTLGNGSDIQFSTALVPGDLYTICEDPVPAGYTFEISVNSGNVSTYAGPPGATDPTGEIQCFDFMAEIAGTTLTFDIENSYPGGAPRTPGYWKNWNSCTDGNQAETADKLNDGDGPILGAGVFLLDDLLPQTIGTLDIINCEDGVLILDARDLVATKKDVPINMANDAAYTLARALLAARLNQDAGACDPLIFEPSYIYTNGMTVEFEYFEEVLTAADNVLTIVDFDGIGGYLGPKNKQAKDLAAYALWLYEIIDDYNNSEICTGEESH